MLVCAASFAGIQFLLQKPHTPPVQVTPVKQSEKRAPVVAAPAITDTQPDAQFLSIPKIGVKNAPVVQLGLTNDGAMDAPKNNTDVGWYDGSGRPGSGKGSALIDGHAGVPGIPGVFVGLGRLAVDDLLTINEKGTVFTYTVKKIETLSAEQVDMRKMMRSIEPDKEGLNLITCSGDFTPSTQRYSDRVLVYAVRV